MKRYIRDNADILLIVAIAALLRLLLFGWFHAEGLTPDEGEYIYLANRLATGEEFIDSNGNYSVRAPGFPMMLSFIFRNLDEGVLASQVLGCIMGGLVVWLGYYVCLMLSNNRRSALTTALVLMLYPGFIIFAGLLQTETLYVVLMLAVFLSALSFVRHRSLTSAALIGLFSGLAALTRAVFFGFFPILLVVIGFHIWRKNRSAVKLLIVSVIVWIVVLTPWTLRNYEIHHRILPVSSGGGSSLLTGNNPYATGTWRLESGFDEWFARQATADGVENLSTLTEVERSEVSGRIARNYITDYPFASLSLALKKAHIFWIYPITNSDSDEQLQLVAVLFDFVLLLGAALGIIFTWKERRRYALVIAAIVFFSLVQIVLHSEARFRLPLIPFLAVWFGIAAANLTDRKSIKTFLKDKWVRYATVTVVGMIVIVYGYTGLMFLSGSL